MLAVPEVHTIGLATSGRIVSVDDKTARQTILQPTPLLIAGSLSAVNVCCAAIVVSDRSTSGC
jgi:hypothetical protein